MYIQRHEVWKEMTPAEKLVQTKVRMHWGWMNQFTHGCIRDGMIDMANEILRLRRKLREEKL